MVSQNKDRFLLKGIFNEAEEQFNSSVPELTEEKVTRTSNKTGKHRGRKEIRADLETKKVVFDLPRISVSVKCAVNSLPNILRNT